MSMSSWRDRKSTRLNSSHLGISYAVFCLKKKKTSINQLRNRDLLRPYSHSTLPASRCKDFSVAESHVVWASSSAPQLTILEFFFNDTATTEIYTLSLHDALPI